MRVSRDIWVISDTHFGHNNILNFKNVPKDTIEKMKKRFEDFDGEIYV